MENLANQLVSQFMQLSWLELVAVSFALAYVWLAAKQNILCWPCALISTAIYTFLFWEVSLPFHTLLNAYYIVMAVYGWWQWNKPNHDKMSVVSWPISRHVMALCGLSCLSVVLALLANAIFDTDYLYLDAFITVFSVFTTVLVAHKVRENWLYWIVINSFSIYLYFVKGLYPTVVLFVLYLGFAVYGYFSWGKGMQSKTATALS